MQEIEQKKGDLAVEKETSETKERIKAWLNDNKNIYLLIIFAFAIIIRLYYFFLTKDQTLWWDESEYTAAANLFAFNVPYEISPQRLVLFPFLISIIFKLGFGELAVRILLVLIPSMLIVLLTYFFVKNMYGKRIALVTTLITSVFWIHLFYSMRVMNDEIGFFFGLLAMFFFWNGYVTKKKYILIYLSAFLIALAFMFRPASIFYAGILICFLFITEGFIFLKKPQLWLMILIFFLTLAPHMVWSHYYHDDALAFRTAYGKPGIVPTLAESFKLMISFMPEYGQKVFFIFFLIGLITLVPMFLHLDDIILKNDKKYHSDLFMFLTVFFIEVAFIFIIWDAENRWLIAMSLGMFVFTAKGILLVFDYLKKNANQIIAVLVLLLILTSGCYFQLKNADLIIKVKIDSYAPIKEAGLWLKDNSQPGEIVFSRSWPQINYYSQRETFTFDTQNETTRKQELLNLLKEKNTSYYVDVAPIFEPGRDWMHEIPSDNQRYFVPLKVLVQDFGDGNLVPVIIIYKIDNQIYLTY